MQFSKNTIVYIETDNTDEAQEIQQALSPVLNEDEVSNEVRDQIKMALYICYNAEPLETAAMVSEINHTFQEWLTDEFA